MLLSANGAAGKALLAQTNVLNEIALMYDLAADYMQRPLMSDRFRTRGSGYNEAIVAAGHVKANNQMFVASLGPCFVGVYVVYFAPSVLEGSLSLGAFIAMLGITKALAGDFNCLFGLLMSVCGSIAPIRAVAKQLNMPTETLAQTKAFGERRRVTNMRLDVEFAKSADSFPPAADRLAMEFAAVTFTYDDMSFSILNNFNAVIPQGSIVHVFGGRGSGKSTFMRLIAGRIFPAAGNVLIPTHLRVLHVCQEPMILNMSLWKNLVFGCSHVPNKDRIVNILRYLSLQECEKILEAPGATEGEGDGSWQRRLAFTSVLKIHIARAFVMNPEVIVMQRPFDHFLGAQDHDLMQDAVRKHVRERGLCLPAEERERRRPRTAFMSADILEHAFEYDMEIELMGDGRAELRGAKKKIKKEDEPQTQ
jgi:ABC-type uncharacterized transport system fused permease/ATPase subunit